MTVTLQLGLPDHLRPDAATLYWEAFGGKLGPVMGPHPRAMAFLVRVIRADHVIVALSAQGELLGLAGFKTPAGSFAEGELADLRAAYGLGAYWRAPLLWLLTREVDNERFLLDGVCVTRAARGLGIGSALLDRICTEARTRGYGAVRLDVIDTNWRAKALYIRLGFIVEKTEGIGLLRHVFGFSHATTMVKPLV